MRPDKKKTRHHDSRKREAKAKGKLEEKEKGKGKQTEERERREENEGEGKEDTRYGRRNVESNWTKYEISSEEEDEEEMARTGEDFEYALQSAGKGVKSLDDP